jgi:hypothetical protein
MLSAWLQLVCIDAQAELLGLLFLFLSLCVLCAAWAMLMSILCSLMRVRSLSLSLSVSRSGDDNVILHDIVRKPFATASDSGESRAFLRYLRII